MAEISGYEVIPGFEAPMHRALTEPILLAGHRAQSPFSTAPSLQRSALASASGLPGSSSG